MGNIYLENKFVESIIYNSEILEQKDLKEKLDINFLKYLNQYLRINKKTQTIDENIKNRLYKIIRYIRFNMGQNSNEEYNNEINKAIVMINQITPEKCLNFYYNQMNARAHNSKNISHDEKIEAALNPSMYDNLCYSICYDYKVLCDLMKKPSEYEKEMVKYVGNEYGWFLCSIKGMNYENPKLFEDENIRNNVFATLAYNISKNKMSKNQKMSTDEINKNIFKR